MAYLAELLPEFIKGAKWFYKFYWKCGDASFEDLKEIFRRFLLCSGWQPATVDKMYLTDEEGDSVED